MKLTDYQDYTKRVDSAVQQWTDMVEKDLKDERIPEKHRPEMMLRIVTVHALQDKLRRQRQRLEETEKSYVETSKDKPLCEQYIDDLIEVSERIEKLTRPYDVRSYQ